MEGKFEILRGGSEPGKELKRGVKKAAERTLREEEKRGQKHIEGEYKKTRLENLFIERINSWLQTEFKDLDIRPPGKISPDRFHLFPDGVFTELFPKAGGRAPGTTRSFEEASYINRDRFVDESGYLDRIALWKSLLHEALEIINYKRYFVDPEVMALTSYRQAYEIIPSEKTYYPGRPSSYFRGFKEAIIQKTTDEIFQKHDEEIAKDLGGIFAKEEMGELPAYTPYVEILNTIIAGVAREKGEEENIVWQRLKKGLFVGDIRHLRDIEETFGKRSLKTLALLGATREELPEEGVLSGEEVDQLIKDYFETDDSGRREEIAEEVISRGGFSRFGE